MSFAGNSMAEQQAYHDWVGNYNAVVTYNSQASSGKKSSCTLSYYSKTSLYSNNNYRSAFGLLTEKAVYSAVRSKSAKHPTRKPSKTPSLAPPSPITQSGTENIINQNYNMQHSLT